MTKGKVLIIEDDLDLAPRLLDLFESWGVRACDMTHRRCVEGAVHGGLDLLHDEGDSFDLMCIDVMLPWDEAKLQACDELQQQWNQLQKEIAQVRDPTGTGKDVITDLRNDLRTLSKEMRATIDRKAGVKMIMKWCIEMREKLGNAWIPHAAILFLTARQEPSLAAEVKEIRDYLGDHSNMRWTTKPAIELQVVTAAAELLVQVRRGR